MDGREWRHWLAGMKEQGTPGTVRVGCISPAVMSALRDRNIRPEVSAILVSKQEMGHIRNKHRLDAMLNDADMERLPDILAKPKAVLLDTQQGGNSLLYVFDPAEPQEDRDRGKVVVRVNFRMRADRKTVTGNAVRTAGYLSIENLQDARYVLLDGDLE